MISVSKGKNKKIRISTQLDKKTTIQVLEKCIDHLKGEEATIPLVKRKETNYD